MQELKAAKWDLWLTVLLTVVNLVGGITFWLSLPEKIRATKEQLADHETRLRALEKVQADTTGTLARIDERTKTIQENVSQLRNDFNFRAQARP